MKFTEQLKTLLSFVNDGNVLCHAGGSKIKKSGITVWSLALTSIGMRKIFSERAISNRNNTDVLIV